MRRSLVTALPWAVQRVSKRMFSFSLCLKQEPMIQRNTESFAKEKSPRDFFRDSSQAKLVRRKWSPAPLMEKPSPIWLRDACNCELCVDPSSKQKRFQTSDIPLEIDYSSEKIRPDGTLSITWSNDIPGFGSNHVSTYTKDFLISLEHRAHEYIRDPMKVKGRYWDKDLITESIRFVDFHEYMSQDAVLYDVLSQLAEYGLVFLRNIPESEKAVEDIGGRIGPLKNTFYGLTWDVKSIPEAKNVAYTHHNLGLHMDLLYTSRPPALQLLHCLKNSCEGGNSLFCDAPHAADQLRTEDPFLFGQLLHQSTTFMYDNAGEVYMKARPVVSVPEQGDSSAAANWISVNWSPPFQGPFNVKYDVHDESRTGLFFSYIKALKALAARIESPENIYEYRLKEGECVIFNNRRVLHARRAFDISSGKRWLKGAYLDDDVFKSRYYVLDRIFGTGAPSMTP